MLQLLTLFGTLVALLSGSIAKDAAADPDVQRQMDAMRSEMSAQISQSQADMNRKMQVLLKQNVNVNGELKALREENVNVNKEMAALWEENVELSAMVHKAAVQPQSFARPPANCVIGNNYRYQEYPESYGTGNPTALPAGGNVYQCLNLCRLDAACLAVSFQKVSPNVCEAYYAEVTDIQSVAGWDYYLLDTSTTCYVDEPSIEFMAGLTSNNYCYNAEEMVVWDTVVYDSGSGMMANGMYHCPVGGTYVFTLTALSNDPVADTSLELRKNNNRIGRLYFYHIDADYTPGSVEVYTFCAADDVISVVSTHTDSCIFNVDSTFLQNSLSGRLVALE